MNRYAIGMWLYFTNYQKVTEDKCLLKSSLCILDPELFIIETEAH